MHYKEIAKWYNVIPRLLDFEHNLVFKIWPKYNYIHIMNNTLKTEEWALNA